MASHMHYDPDVDIAFLAFETGRAIGESHSWGLIERHPEDGHLMGFEIWQASKMLPAELLAAMPRAGHPSNLAA